MAWEKRAVCGCGETFRATFGDMLFVREECCPECGADKSTFRLKTVRWVPAVRSAMWPFGHVIEPEHWEEKASNQ